MLHFYKIRNKYKITHHHNPEDHNQSMPKIILKDKQQVHKVGRNNLLPALNYGMYG
jgi:hypothetical protein